MNYGFDAVILTHVVAALLALPVGGAPFLMQKGNRLHRYAGRTWVALMLLAAFVYYAATGKLRGHRFSVSATPAQALSFAPDARLPLRAAQELPGSAVHAPATAGRKFSQAPPRAQGRGRLGEGEPAPVNALIADHEPLLALSLKTALGEVWPELEIAAVLPNGLEAVVAAERLRPDIAFLDIRMPGMDGLEAAAEIADRMGDAAPAIVFVTAYDEYATQAFEVAAVDYVLKPVSLERLAGTAARLKTKQHNLEQLARALRSIGTLSPKGEMLRQVRAGSGNSVKLIPVDDVCYFQAADKYTTVVTAGGEDLIRTPLKELAAQLPEAFQQVHRGTIVNLKEVAMAVRDESGRVALKLRSRKETLAVSRVYADLFRPM